MYAQPCPPIQQNSLQNMQELSFFLLGGRFDVSETEACEAPWRIFSTNKVRQQLEVENTINAVCLRVRRLKRFFY
jgi:hypothetical protein